LLRLRQVDRLALHLKLEQVKESPMAHKTTIRQAATTANSPRGKLLVVGTPIGNLEDITFRAVRALKEADLVACEDTRRTQQLLNYYRIKTETVSYHEHNELMRAPELILEMEQGGTVALVSDAGMPTISDPGYRLVHLAIRHGIPVVPIPGASAFVAALAASGLPIDCFRFLGFLPAKKLARRKALAAMRSATKALVFYEAPHRLIEMLEDVRDILGDRPVVVAREVTKLHEEFVRGSISEVLDRLGKKTVKGEITVIVGKPEGPVRPTAPSRRLHADLERVMSERGADLHAALKIVARERGISKSEAYRQYQMEKSAER
jgi:16S rRNA (cytidine1402-2'-O)-methyltransferase